MTDAKQPQSHSEQTDPVKLGETVGQHDRPGDVYPPDQRAPEVAAAHEIPRAQVR